MAPIFAIDSSLRALALGLPGLQRKNALIFGSRSFFSSFVGELPALLLPRLDVDDLEVVVLEVRHLEVGREDRRGQGDRVTRIEQPVGLHGLEDVAHGGGAALDRVEVERALGARLAAHGPLQVLPDDLLVVDQHPVRHRVVVADDGVDQLVDEGIGVEAELLHRPRNHGGKDGSTRHVGVLRQPGLEPGRDAFLAGHAAHAGRQVEDALALGDRELAQEEEGLAGLGGDPVRDCRARHSGSWWLMPGPTPSPAWPGRS